MTASQIQEYIAQGRTLHLGSRKNTLFLSPIEKHRLELHPLTMRTASYLIYVRMPDHMIRPLLESERFAVFLATDTDQPTLSHSDWLSYKIEHNPDHLPMERFFHSYYKHIPIFKIGSYYFISNYRKGYRNLNQVKKMISQLKPELV